MRITKTLVFILAILPGLAAAAPQQVGLIPIPTLTGVTVHAQVSSTIDQTSFVPVYSYTYTISNPASNTGKIWWIQIDVSAPRSNIYNIPGDFLLPRGASTMFFGDVQDETDSIVITNQTDPAVQTNVIPFGITAPSGWNGSLTVNQTGGFFASSPLQAIQPGQTVTGFTMTSVGVPTIRTMILAPDWTYEVAGESTLADAQIARQTEKALDFPVQVVAPSHANVGSDDQFNQMRADIGTMMQLGWITDTAFGNGLLAKLQAARTIFDQSGGFQATNAMSAYLAAIKAATPAQLNNDALAVLAINAQAMLDTFPPDDEGPLPSPKASIVSPTTTPIVATVGTTVTVVQQVVDQAANDAPLSGYVTRTRVVSGPDQNLHTPNGATTDSNGQLNLAITGSAPGVDVVAINPSYAPSEDGPYQTVSIVWVGGADLVMQEFTPPVVHLNNQGSFQITDTIKNNGTAAIGPTDTGFYLSSTYPVDPTSAYFLGSRPLSALQPGASSFDQFQQAVPTDLSPGNYYMLACANYDRGQVERDYANNCVALQMVAVAEATNSPPVCSSATPSQNLLWPPNHKFVNIAITGVTDPNNLTPTVTITGIQQDEPVNASGDGNTAPDGAGTGTSTAQLRSERSGIAQGGRLYFIAFSATDSDGGSCTGTVTVGVPHDQGQHNLPVDNGQRYDSTATH